MILLNGKEYVLESDELNFMKKLYKEGFVENKPRDDLLDKTIEKGYVSQVPSSKATYELTTLGYMLLDKLYEK